MHVQPLNTAIGAREHPAFQVRYEWADGDVAIWDERPTQHYAVADHFPQRREMARTNAA